MFAPPATERRRLMLAGLSAALLAAAGCSKSGPAVRSLPKEATLLCLGDSLTFGYGAAAGTAYPEQLEALTGHATRNAGLNGDTSEGALARLPGLLQAGSPGLVLLSIGGNDFLRKWPEERTRAALTQLVQTAAAATQVVLIAQPRPALMAAALGSLNDHPVYAEVAAATGVPLFEGGWAHVLSRTELRSDQIHANSEGYKVFAERLAGWLRKQKFIA
ncbi:MAG: GDSL-type esterase/lipase family protein [Polaromonas sp.]|nr:GDSL-type esterase/lipase family protein [Polaromonas sp.]